MEGVVGGEEGKEEEAAPEVRTPICGQEVGGASYQVGPERI